MPLASINFFNHPNLIMVISFQLTRTDRSLKPQQFDNYLLQLNSRILGDSPLYLKAPVQVHCVRLIKLHPIFIHFQSNIFSISEAGIPAIQSSLPRHSSSSSDSSDFQQRTDTRPPQDNYSPNTAKKDTKRPYRKSK